MNLRSLRVEKGYSLQQVAEGTGLPKASLCHWESGERQPAADVLPKLAEFYGITTDELLGYKAPTVPAVEDDEETEYEIKDEHGIVKRNVEIGDLEIAIQKDLSSVKKSFFKIGYKLSIIQKYALFTKLGYQSLADYAEDKFGFGKTTTYNFIDVYKLTCDGIRPTEIDKQFIPYNYSQLVEISGNRYIWKLNDLMNVISPTDSTRDIKEYVKLWNKNFDNYCEAPKGNTVKEALEIAARQEERKNAISAPTVVVSESNACPGQTSMFDEDPEVDPSEEYTFVPQGESFSSGGVATAYVDMSEDPENLEEDNREEEFVQNRETTVRHIFKNATEREAFIRDKNNYAVLVLENKELRLKISRLDFANGAKVYRSEYLEYTAWNKMDITRVAYCLIDDRQIEKPESKSEYIDYSLKYFNFNNMSVGYIVKYMTMYKDEI